MKELIPVMKGLSDPNRVKALKMLTVRPPSPAASHDLRPP